jgi:hypothetical protein
MVVGSALEIVIHEEEGVAPFVGLEHFQGGGDILPSFAEVVVYCRLVCA